MAFKEALLPLVGDLGPAIVVAIEKCVAMAVDIGPVFPLWRLSWMRRSVLRR